VLARVAGATVTYREVGATKDEALPAGYHHDRRSVSIGRGDAVFRRGQDAIRQWQAHRGACKIVYVTDDPDRFGFG
jgi:uncharacterized protein (UPF0548 family)